MFRLEGNKSRTFGQKVNIAHRYHIFWRKIKKPRQLIVRLVFLVYAYGNVDETDTVPVTPFCAAD